MLTLKIAGRVAAAVRNSRSRLPADQLRGRMRCGKPLHTMYL
jgi:hypothetical protein